MRLAISGFLTGWLQRWTRAVLSLLPASRKAPVSPRLAPDVPAPPADWLERARPVAPQHWLEVVRDGAPQLLEAAASADVIDWRADEADSLIAEAPPSQPTALPPAPALQQLGRRAAPPSRAPLRLVAPRFIPFEPGQRATEAVKERPPLPRQSSVMTPAQPVALPRRKTSLRAIRLAARVQAWLGTARSVMPDVPAPVSPPNIAALRLDSPEIHPHVTTSAYPGPPRLRAVQTRALAAVRFDDRFVPHPPGAEALTFEALPEQRPLAPPQLRERDDRWPSLLDDAPEPAPPTSRDDQRRQRLDAEQEGRWWNE